MWNTHLYEYLKVLLILHWAVKTAGRHDREKNEKGTKQHNYNLILAPKLMMMMMMTMITAKTLDIYSHLRINRHANGLSSQRKAYKHQ